MTKNILIATSCCCAVFANDQIIEVYAPILTPADTYFSQENAI